ncbi:multiple antibiotic resistance-relatedprotein [Diplodia corticola]|uniref:Multiple antibiotic resistance-relatedprotein n=1 Tax=Diplodia corticola TaxID=236234 RepID=A0A1J9RRW6_9PEZI|nr:multiple antibiotic resistance-relatedprotein [Diplodia corticola]OJD30269.1 multiple antibiotic resistance-relatedprotein [Diplodia corticola]
MLFIWQVMKNLGNDINYETSKYWAVVLRVTREEMPIGKTGLDIPASYVAMIAGLAVAETWLGNFPASRHHRAAMLALVAARGGFATFGPMAQRSLKWCEFYPCASLALAPQLPRLRPPSPHSPQLPPFVRAATDAAHRRTAALLPVDRAPPPLSAVFYRLHVVVGEWRTERPSFTGVLDELEHVVLVELAGMRGRVRMPPEEEGDVVTAGGGADDDDDVGLGSAAAVAAAAPMDVVYAGLLQAAQMCVFGTMPFTRKEAPMYGAFVQVLRGVLDSRGDGDVVGVWTAVASAQSLLWVLFMGWSTAAQLKGDAQGAVENARWFIRHFAAVVAVLGIRDLEGLAGVMAEFPWSRETYSALLGVLWDICLHSDEINVT